MSVCPRTVRGRLPEIGLRGCKARPKPLLTEFQRKRRLMWAREHSLWTIKDWEKASHLRFMERRTFDNISGVFRIFPAAALMRSSNGCLKFHLPPEEIIQTGKVWRSGGQCTGPVHHIDSEQKY
ncbi:hypothetical protein TNCV_2008691 [Trichonephila clavipes]|nr:hypothetical protein TNCV_2008691 [Trichonephila clavipes]